MNQGDKVETEQWLDMHRDDPDAFGQVLAGKLKDLTGTGIGPQCNLHYSNVRVAYTHLYGFDMEGVGANASMVTRSGDQGNIAELRVPASAGLLRKAFNIVVGPELTWSAVATTTDFASEAQAVTARNALEYYWRHEMFGATAKAVQFNSMAFAECAMHIPWDPNAGKDMGADTSSVIPSLTKSGDMRFARIPTWDIIRDPTAHSRESLTFIIVREWPDKYDVAASVRADTPEKTDELKTKVLSYGASPPSAQAWLPFRVTYDANSKRIPVYYLYALRSDSCLPGRMTRFLEDGTVLNDAKLDEAYVDLPGTIGPVVWTTSGGYEGTPWPYTKWMGTLGSEQGSDALRRDLLTNATATSGNVLSVPEDQIDAGASIAFQTGGPQLIPRKPGAPNDLPVVLQLQQSHPEHFKLLATLGGEQQQIMGIDQLTSGNLAALPSSGALAALMTSTSVQNNSQEQAAWTDFVQRCGNVILRHIQKHMKTPKRIALAGNARSALVTTTEVSGTEVEGIERVIATIGSARQQTDAGRYEIATEALKNQWVKTPEQFQTVLDTGRLDALTEDLSNELLLIKSENEALGRGEQVVVMLTDDHKLHIKGHAAVTSSVTARQDPKVVQAQQAHVDSHIRALRETDPTILQILGQPQAAPAPGPPPGAPPGPGGNGPPPPPKPPQMQQKADAPSLPTNPATGVKAAPAGGVTPPQLAVRPS